MAGEPAEHVELGREVEEEAPAGDEQDSKPTRKGGFSSFWR